MNLIAALLQALAQKKDKKANADKQALKAKDEKQGKRTDTAAKAGLLRIAFKPSTCHGNLSSFVNSLPAPKPPKGDRSRWLRGLLTYWDMLGPGGCRSLCHQDGKKKRGKKKKAEEDFLLWSNGAIVWNLC